MARGRSTPRRIRRSRSDLARASGDQTGRDNLVRGGRAVAVEAAEEQLGRGGSHRGGALGDDRNPGVEHVGEQDVVEADEGDLVMESEPPKCSEDADAEQVLSGENRRSRGAQSEELRCLFFCPFGATEVEPDQVGVEREMLRLQLLAVALVAKRRGHDALKVAQIGDALMAVPHEMLDASSRSAEVIDENRVRV